MRKKTLSPYDMFKRNKFHFVLYFDKPLTLIKGLHHTISDTYESEGYDSAYECNMARINFEITTKCFREKLKDEIVEREEFDQIAFEVACSKLL
jgi:hypothetical protein